MRKKILIVPIHTGLAHMVRSVALAEELVKKHDVTIEFHRDKAKYFPLSKKIKTIISDEEGCDDILKLYRRYLRNIGIKPLIDRYIKIIDEIKPDLIISDVHPAAIIAAIIRNKKQAMLNNSELIPYSLGIPGWFGEPKTLLQKILSWPTERLLDFWKRFFIGIVVRYVRLYGIKKINLDQLIHETPFIFPEVREYVRLRKYLPNFHYVGPIVYDKIEGRDPKLEKELEEKARLRRGFGGRRKIIFLTFGGTGYGKNLLLDLIQKLVDENYFVIVAAGNIIEPNDVKNQPENLFVRKFIPGFSAAKIADVVLSHGSYGTVVQALHSGKPIVCVPFNIDQVFHGLKVKEMGIGKSLVALRLHHFYMDMDKQQKMAESLDAEKIVKAVDEVINDPKYAKNAKKFSKYFQELDGAKKASEIISQVFRSESHST